MTPTPLGRARLGLQEFVGACGYAFGRRANLAFGWLVSSIWYQEVVACKGHFPALILTGPGCNILPPVMLPGVGAIAHKQQTRPGMLSARIAESELNPTWLGCERSSRIHPQVMPLIISGDHTWGVGAQSHLLLSIPNGTAERAAMRRAIYLSLDAAVAMRDMRSVRAELTKHLLTKIDDIIVRIVEKTDAHIDRLYPAALAAAGLHLATAHESAPIPGRLVEELTGFLLEREAIPQATVFFDLLKELVDKKALDPRLVIADTNLGIALAQTPILSALGGQDSNVVAEHLYNDGVLIQHRVPRLIAGRMMQCFLLKRDGSPEWLRELADKLSTAPDRAK